MSSAKAYPGAVCRWREAEGGASRVLLVTKLGGGGMAARYPLEEPIAPISVRLEDLEPEDLDEASARVLGLRWRTAAVEAPWGAASPVKTAMVLCAGMGLRLRPLTLVAPKPALSFFRGPLVRYSFALLKSAGVEKVVINTHHLPRIMEEVAGVEAERLGLKLHVSHERTIQGTAGAIRDARRHLCEGPFLLLNGDSFMCCDLRRLVAEHQALGSQATMAVSPMPPGETFAAVEATADRQVRRIAGIGPGGEGLTPWHFIGAHVIEPTIFDFIPASGRQDINRVVYPAMVAAGRAVQVCPLPLGAWADMGTPRRYLQACEEIMTGLCDLSALGDWGPLAAGQAEQLRKAGIEGRVVIDPSARVSEMASLQRAQVGPEAKVGRSVVRRAAILPGSCVEDGETVQDAIALGELRVAASTNG
jgi:mannose-1-phosphate guanylyltransferase